MLLNCRWNVLFVAIVVCLSCSFIHGRVVGGKTLLRVQGQSEYVPVKMNSQGLEMAGVPAGKDLDRPTDPTASCFNSNKIILGRSTKSMQSMGEEEICGVLLENFGEKVANARTFFKNCQIYLGTICNHQCMQIAYLFDRLDYSKSSPSGSGPGYVFNTQDCTNCLLEGDCYMPPNVGVRYRPIVANPWFPKIVQIPDGESIPKALGLPDMPHTPSVAKLPGR